ncbi:MAG: ABC transporter permease subunit [Erysipelotrichaceae bacterium]|jgi:sodium transport system permease protein|nr:ABC transporter permease subunit [Erysipelotrichaceae bacterium]
MKNIFTIIKKEFARVFKDKQLVFSVLILPAFIMILVYSVIGLVMQSYNDTSNKTLTVEVINESEFVSGILTNPELDLNVRIISINETEEEAAKKRIENQDTHLFLIIDKDFDEKLSYLFNDETHDITDPEFVAPTIQIYYNRANQQSATLFSILKGSFDALALEVNPTVIKDIYSDLGTDRDQSAVILSILVPMLLMSTLIQSVMSLTPDSIAGEKERGTMASLLVAPIKRSDIVIGKVVSQTGISLLSAASNFIGMMIGLPIYLNQGMGLTISLEYSFWNYLAILAIAFATVLFIVAIISLLSTIAKTTKQAISFSSVVLIISVVASFATFFAGKDNPFYLFFVPFLNVSLTLNEILNYHFNALNFSITIVTMVAFSVGLVFVINALFKKEKYILNSN